MTLGVSPAATLAVDAVVIAADGSGHTDEMSRSGVLRCLLAAVLFGATAPAASELAGSIPAFTLAGLLYVGAAFAVIPAVVMRRPTSHAIRTEWRPALAAVVAGGRSRRSC